MRKILFGLLAVLLVISVYAATTDLAGYKTYTLDPQPDSMYFVMYTNVPQGTSMIAWTNYEAYAWVPSEIRFALRPDKPFTNTFTFTRIAMIPIESEKKYNIITNEFGNLQTNWMHAITNVTYLAVTNEIISNTTTNSTNFVFELSNTYVRYGDVVQFSWTDTTNKWLNITATR